MNRDKKSYAVFGMGEFGKSVVMELARNGADVMAIDDHEENLADVAEYITDARLMDATDIKAYEKIGLSNIDAVVVAIAENMDASLMAILQSVEAGVTEIIVKAISEVQAKIFSKVGATKIITPEKSEGIRLARTLFLSNVFEFVELKDGICMLEMAVKKEWCGKSLLELDLRKNYAVNVIAVLRDGMANFMGNPKTVLNEGEHLLVVTDMNHVEKLLK